MAITYPDERDNVFEITNGHLNQLQEIQRVYGIDGEAKTLAFVIAAINAAEGLPITINGKTIQPSEEIKTKRV